MNGLEFIFSRRVAKPRKFTHSIAMPDVIPSLPVIPPIEGPDPLDVNISDITLIADPWSADVRAAAIRAFPGPIFVSILGHRVRTYRPFPCLCVVMTSDGAITAFDILALRNNIAPIADILIDPDAVHVMRDPDADLRMLAESFGLYVSNVFPVDGPDGNVVVDWRIRPLTDQLLDIAAESVARLPQLARARIEAMPIDELLRDAQKYAVPKAPQYVFGEEEIEAAVDEIGADDADRAMVVDLVKWRDATAVLEDEAPNFIAPNECLRRIAVEKPRTRELMRELLAEVGTPFMDSLIGDLDYIVRTHCGGDPALAGALLPKLGSP
jgi:hypothetical protein